MKRLKILHVGRIDERQFSGVATVVPNYLRYQAKYADVALLNLAHFTPSGSDTSYKTYVLGECLLEDVMALFGEPDLVVFHEVYHRDFIKLAKKFKRRSIPYVITPHVSLTDTAQHHKRLKKIIGNVLVFNKFIYGASAIHYLSESEKAQSSMFNKIPSFICNNGIDLKGRMKKSFSKEGLKLIYVGRLEIKIKGIDRILDAANIVQNEMRRKKITISIRGYDEGNNATWIDKTINKYGIGDIVTLGGALFGDEKTQEILKHDCFLQLSRTEGQPLAIMEAMDIGMPCVVTEGTTFAGIVAKNGLGMSVGDLPNGIAHSIVDFQVEKPRFKDMSLSAAHYAKKTFAWASIAEEMIWQYRDILDEESNKRAA